MWRGRDLLIHQGDMRSLQGKEPQEQDYDRTRASAVIGFFSSHQDMEEDEHEEFLEVAKALRHRDDLHFGVVTAKKIAESFKKAKIIDRTPSLVLYGCFCLHRNATISGTRLLVSTSSGLPYRQPRRAVC